MICQHTADGHSLSEGILIGAKHARRENFHA
jgi:hypothetical protein